MSTPYSCASEIGVPCCRHERRSRPAPGVYAIFLTLRDEGLDDMDIANRLGTPVESLPLLARLAEAKSARLAGEKKCEVASSKDDA